MAELVWLNFLFGHCEEGQLKIGTQQISLPVSNRIVIGYKFEPALIDA